MGLGPGLGLEVPKGCLLPSRPLHLGQVWRGVDPGGQRAGLAGVMQRRDGEPVPEAADLVRGRGRVRVRGRVRCQGWGQGQ